MCAQILLGVHRVLQQAGQEGVPPVSNGYWEQKTAEAGQKHICLARSTKGKFQTY